jgi:hypothetical protein
MTTEADDELQGIDRAEHDPLEPVERRCAPRIDASTERLARCLEALKPAEIKDCARHG